MIRAPLDHRSASRWRMRRGATGPHPPRRHRGGAPSPAKRWKGNRVGSSHHRDCPSPATREKVAGAAGRRRLTDEGLHIRRPLLTPFLQQKGHATDIEASPLHVTKTLRPTGLDSRGHPRSLWPRKGVVHAGIRQSARGSQPLHRARTHKAQDAPGQANRQGSAVSRAVKGPRAAGAAIAPPNA